MRMWNKAIKSCLIGSLCFFMGQSSFADTLQFDFKFTKKPPASGILYVPEAGSPPISGEVDQKDKVFLERIVPISPGTELVLKNSDSVDHNIFANDLSDANIRFDVGLMPVGAEMKVPVDWPLNSFIRVGCKIHPKMKTYIISMDAKSYKIIEMQKKIKEYTFNLEDVASDAKTVRVALEKYDPIELELSAGETKEVELFRRGKPRGSLVVTRQ